MLQTPLRSYFPLGLARLEEPVEAQNLPLARTLVEHER